MSSLVDDYLQCKLTQSGQYQLTKADKILISERGIEEYLFQKITSGAFVQWKPSKETREGLRATISSRINKNLPIKFGFPFGGYKLWSLPTSPEVDWAEFFNIA
jgi:hypothetical protein